MKDTKGVRSRAIVATLDIQTKATSHTPRENTPRSDVLRIDPRRDKALTQSDSEQEFQSAGKDL